MFFWEQVVIMYYNDIIVHVLSFNLPISLQINSSSISVLVLGVTWKDTKYAYVHFNILISYLCLILTQI